MDPTRDDPRNQAPKAGPLLPNADVDEFFLRMKNDLRRPKPSDEAIAEALRAIQTLTGDSAEADVDGALKPSVPAQAPISEHIETCRKCGGPNSVDNRFCGFCGAALRADRGKKPEISVSASARQEQHVHHHYHYHLLPEDHRLAPEVAKAAAQVGDIQKIQPPNIDGAESALRTLAQNWILAFNSKRLDGLAALYASGALLLRPDAVMVRGPAAIRQQLETAVRAGLGDVLFDGIEVAIIGEIGRLSGRSRMLVPIAPGRRQERTGQFLMLARLEGSHWKILADVWCLDAAPLPSEGTTRKRA